MRKNVGFIFAILLAFFLLSCRPKYSPKPIFISENNFESVYGWINNSTNNSHTVCAGDAHSGRYAYRVNKDLNFGYFYKIKFKDVSDKKIRWVKVSGYFKQLSQALKKTGLACSVLDEKDNTQNWSEVPLMEFTFNGKGKWVYFEKDFDISAFNTDPNCSLSTFVWTTATDEEVLVDDVKIQFYE